MINEMDHWQTVWNKQVRTNRALPMDPNFLAGKILRMEADTPDGILGGLPDNPFYTGNMTLARAKVWAVGLRNPFRCSHLGSSDEIICGIVGSYSWEQITRVRRGANIGWPCWEAGNNRQPDYAPTTPVCKKMFADGAEAFGYVPVDHSSAIHIWVHNGTSACSIGGVTIPSYYPASLRNRYLFADYARNWIMAFNLADGSVAPFATDADGPITFKVSPFDGNIYYTSLVC